MFAGVRHGLRVASFAVALCVAVASAYGQGAKFEHLARPQFTKLGRIDGISANGSRVVATFATNPEGIDRPVAWDAAGAGKILGLLPEPGYAGTFLANFRQPISADGSLIGGYCQTYDDPSGFWGSPPVSWDASGAIRQLKSPFVGDSVSYSGWVSAVSPDGAYMYGWCQVPGGYFRPFRWNAAGEATMLQTMSGTDRPLAWSIAATSTDGTIAVGIDDFVHSAAIGYDYRPVRWKADGSVETLRLLGTDADGRAQGEAQLCSGDGSVVVGWVQKYGSGGAYIKNANVCWLPDGKIVELPRGFFAMTPSGKTIVGDGRMDLVDGKVVVTELASTGFGVIYAQDVSDDGRVMAGGGSPRSSHPGAQVWIYNRMHRLEDLLAARGVKLPSGWASLDWIYFCSADGKVFIGEGTFGTERTVFRATIPDILVDKEKPVIETLAPIRRLCDPGKPFATVNLRKPKATDNFPGKVVVTTTAGSRFKIGTTNVVWKATDRAGNVARKTQNVIVTARRSSSNAEGGAEDAHGVQSTQSSSSADSLPMASIADEAFASAATEAGASLAGGSANPSAASGFAFASLAAGYGGAAGELARCGEVLAEEDALLWDAQVRRAQAASGEAAVQALLSAYAESGDENLISAYQYAAYGTGYAAADLNEQ